MASFASTNYRPPRTHFLLSQRRVSIQSITDAIALGQSIPIRIDDRRRRPGNFIFVKQARIVDTLALSDDVHTITSLSRLSDALALSDSVTRQTTVSFSPTDTITITQSETNAQYKSVVDTVSFGQAIPRLFSDRRDARRRRYLNVKYHTVFVTQTIALTDLATPTALHQRVVDALALSDALLPGSIWSRHVVDTIGVTDYPVVNGHRYLADSLAFTEVTIRGGVNYRTVAQTLTFTSRTVGPQHDFANTVVLTETVRVAQVVTIAVADRLAISDVEATYPRGVADAIQLEDNNYVDTSRVQPSVLDSIRLTDSASVGGTRNVSVTDGINFGSYVSGYNTTARCP